jgi:hypothetical protein
MGEEPRLHLGGRAGDDARRLPLRKPRLRVVPPARDERAPFLAEGHRSFGAGIPLGEQRRELAHPLRFAPEAIGDLVGAANFLFVR